MEKEKPTIGVILSLIGSIFIFLNGIKLLTTVGEVAVPAGVNVSPQLLEHLVFLLGIMGISFGILVGVGSILMRMGYKSKGSLVAIIFSLASFLVGGGTFLFLPFLGLILGLIGGILGRKEM